MIKLSRIMNFHLSLVWFCTAMLHSSKLYHPEYDIFTASSWHNNKILIFSCVTVDVPKRRKWSAWEFEKWITKT